MPTKSCWLGEVRRDIVLRYKTHSHKFLFSRLLTWGSFAATLSSLLVFIYVMYSPIIVGSGPDVRALLIPSKLCLISGL